MVTKQKRQTAIRRIVRADRVGTQAQLVKTLRKSGMACDQTLLSRDLGELGIRKIGGRYVIPAREKPSDVGVDLSTVVHGFVGCGPHLIVVRTAVGQAQPVAVAIDRHADPAIVATLAGDDTLFVATKNRRSQTVAMRRLEQWFGDKHGR